MPFGFSHNSTFSRGVKVNASHNSHDLMIFLCNFLTDFLSHLGQSSSFDEIIEFTKCSVPGKTLDIPEEILRFCFKQTPEERGGQKKKT